MKKILAFVLAMIMVMAMGTVAFAVEGTQLPVTGTSGTFTATFKKDLWLKDETSTSTLVYAPDVTYSYSADYVEALVGADAGKPESVSVANIVYSNADEPKADAALQKTGEITIVLGANAKAGVYTYTMKETSTNRETNGVTRESTYTDTRTLIIYVTNVDPDDPSKGVEVSAVQLAKTVKVEGQEDTVTKTEGWTSTTTGGEDLDTYETVDVTITKEITGDLADKTHQFPFTIVPTFTNGSLVKQDTDTTYSATGTNFTADLANGDSTVIYSLPKNAQSTLNITEKNDTDDKYKVTTTGLATNLSAVEMTDKTTPHGGDTANITDTLTVKFTNDLPTPSITGLTLRFAPYLIMIGAGIVLLAISRKRKANED